MRTGVLRMIRSSTSKNRENGAQLCLSLIWKHDTNDLLEWQNKMVGTTCYLLPCGPELLSIPCKQYHAETDWSATKPTGVILTI